MKINTLQLSLMLALSQAGVFHQGHAAELSQEQIEEVNFHRNTALMHAITKGNSEKLKALIEAGADVNSQAYHGPTPLLWSTMVGDTHSMKALINAGAHVDMVQDSPRGNTPLIWAAGANRAREVQVLLKAGAQINVQNAQGNTPLIEAADYGHYQIIKMLIDAGADLNTHNRFGLTALMIATLYYTINPNNYRKTLEVLIAARADINRQNHQGKTALLLSHSAESSAILLRGKALIDLQDHEGNNALIDASENSCQSLTELLLAKGANPFITNKKGISAFDLITKRHWMGRTSAELEELIYPEFASPAPLIMSASATLSHRCATSQYVE